MGFPKVAKAGCETRSNASLFASMIDWREIEAELAALGVPLGDFYQRAGIHRSTWARFRDGKFELRADTARRISAALKVIRAEKSGKPSSGGSDPSDSGDVECAPMERA